jgi:hypothetical protein
VASKLVNDKKVEEINGVLQEAHANETNPKREMREKQ